MECTDGQVVEHAITRAKIPVRVMRAPGHVASKTARLHGVFGGFHRTAHEHERAFDHRRRPRRQPDALLLLVRQFAGEKTVDVVRIVGEQQKRRVDRLRLGDVHRLTRAGRFKPVEKTLVAVAGKRASGWMPSV